MKTISAQHEVKQHAQHKKAVVDKDDIALIHFIKQHPSLFVLTGAGCSTASGLGDYRDSQGQWKRQQPITGQVFIGDELARKRYWARGYVGWGHFSRAKPSSAHKALVELQRSGYIEQLVTQNVDQLHQRAGHQDVTDLHGVLATVSCLNCARSLQRDDYQLRLLEKNPWLQHLSAEHAPDGDAHLEPDNVHTMQVPPCDHCGGMMKPDVVFFGENVPKEKVQHSMDSLSRASALLVVGSSLMVYSGFRFCRAAQQRGQAIAIINNGVTRADALASLKIGGDCGTRLNTLVHALQLTT